MRAKGGIEQQRLLSDYGHIIDTAIEERTLARNPISEGIAVGSKGFIETVSGQIRNRVRLTTQEVGAGIWIVQESRPAYAPISQSRIGAKSTS